MTDKFTIVNMGLNGSFIKENGKIMEIGRVVDLLNKGEHLKQSHKEILRDLEVTTFDKELLQKENEQLKQRNDRQAKQLDRIYQLIEEKDWRTLNDILDDFKQCEEQLQREWKCYE